MKRFHVILLLAVPIILVQCSEESFFKEIDRLSRDKNSLGILTRSDSVTLSTTLFTEGKVTVDWGDGATETFDVKGGEGSFWFVATHAYNKVKAHKISLMGDLEKVVDFTIEIGPSDDPTRPLHLMNLGSLPVLASLTSYSDIDIANLDFSKNMYIRGIILPNASVRKFKLPLEHNLMFIDLNGAGSNYDVNAIIETVYNNAVHENIQEGYFRIINHSVLSSESLQYLSALREDYSWNIQF